MASNVIGIIMLEAGLENVKNRKLLVTLIITLATILALFFDKLSGDQFMELMKWVLGLYGAANVAVKMTPQTSYDRVE